MKPEIWNGISSEGKDFVRSLLMVCPEDRLSAQQALEHSWIANKHASIQSNIAEVAQSLHEFSHFSIFRRCCMKALALSLPHQDQAKLCDAFLALNTSHTGAITLLELKSIMAEKNITDDCEVRRIFSALDYNNDQKINYSDLLAAMASNMNIEGDSVRLAFQAFDKDGSGCIIASNLRDVLGKWRVHAYIREVDQQKKGHISFADFEIFLKTDSSKLDDDGAETKSFVRKRTGMKRAKLQKIFALFSIFVGHRPA
jgi:Ca2+-binding EF-hand superfamily protein